MARACRAPPPPVACDTPRSSRVRAICALIVCRYLGTFRSRASASRGGVPRAWWLRQDVSMALALTKFFCETRPITGRSVAFGTAGFVIDFSRRRAVELTVASGAIEAWGGGRVSDASGGKGGRAEGDAVASVECRATGARSVWSFDARGDVCGAWSRGLRARERSRPDGTPRAGPGGRSGGPFDARERRVSSGFFFRRNSDVSGLSEPGLRPRVAFARFAPCRSRGGQPRPDACSCAWGAGRAPPPAAG